MSSTRSPPNLLSTMCSPNTTSYSAIFRVLMSSLWSVTQKSHEVTDELQRSVVWLPRRPSSDQNRKSRVHIFHMVLFRNHNMSPLVCPFIDPLNDWFTQQIIWCSLWTRLRAQFSSVAQSCPALCDPMNCSTPGLPVHHQLPEATQTQAWVRPRPSPQGALLYMKCTT